MINRISSGESYNYTVPDNAPIDPRDLTFKYAILSGDGVLCGSLFGVASNSAAPRDTINVNLVGTFGLRKAQNVGFKCGDKAYFDPKAKVITSDPSCPWVGVATEDIDPTDLGLAKTRLNGFPVDPVAVTPVRPPTA